MGLLLLVSEARKIHLGRDGTERARCQHCAGFTGSKALAYFRLRGLYCSEHCIMQAAEKSELWGEPYARTPPRSDASENA